MSWTKAHEAALQRAQPATRSIAEPDAQVLLALHEHTTAFQDPDPHGAVHIDVRELARRMGLRSATVGAACARLLTAGVLDRIGEPTQGTIPVYAVSALGSEFVATRKAVRR